MGGEREASRFSENIIKIIELTSGHGSCLGKQSHSLQLFSLFPATLHVNRAFPVQSSSNNWFEIHAVKKISGA